MTFYLLLQGRELLGRNSQIRRKHKISAFHRNFGNICQTLPKQFSHRETTLYGVIGFSGISEGFLMPAGLRLICGTSVFPIILPMPLSP